MKDQTKRFEITVDQRSRLERLGDSIRFLQELFQGGASEVRSNIPSSFVFPPNAPCFDSLQITVGANNTIRVN